MSNKTNPLENLEEELVDYVSNTPNNTNPSVVKSMVRTAADGVSTGGSKEPLFVHFVFIAEDGWCDKTYNEILEAVEAGRPIHAFNCHGNIGRISSVFGEVYFDTYFDTYNVSERFLRFWSVYALNNDSVKIQYTHLYSNNSITNNVVTLK